MAVPTLTANLTTLSDCESTTGWSGDTFILDPDIKKQGANSLSCSQTNNGVNTITFTPPAPVNLTGQHVRFWINSALTAYMNTAALAGMEFLMSDGTNTARWTVGGSDTYAGGWYNIVIFAGSTPTSGTVNVAAVTSFTFQINTNLKPRNTVNLWFDYLRYGDGIIATGGTSGDPITLAGIAAQDLANGYGILENVDDVMFASGSIQVGNGATATYLRDLGDVLVFTNKNVSSTLYKLIGVGSGCEIQIAGGLYKAAGPQSFTLDMDDGTLAAFSMTGKQIVSADASLFKSGQSITQCVFDYCGQINPLTAIFNNNTISNSTDINGALYVPQTHNISDCKFINNLYSTYINQAGPYTYTGMIFDDLGTADVYNAFAGTVIVNKVGGSNPNSYAGNIVTFVATFNHILTNLVLNTEVTYVRVSDGAELFHVESVDGTGITQYTHGGGEVVDVLIHHIDYQPDISNIPNLTLPNADASVKIQQFPDPNYENPT